MSIALLALLFAVILPQVIDYRQVWDIATSLTTKQFVVLLALGIIRIGVSASQHAALSRRSLSVRQ